MGLFKALKSEKGGVLVYLVMGIVPIVAMAGLVTDYGMAAVCASKMQRAVDAAALAGASMLPDENAVGKAEDLAETNYQLYDDCDVTVTGEEVAVTMERSVSTHFMKMFGFDNIQVDVTATAIRGLPVGKVTGHLMPFCVINPNTNNDSNDDLTPSNWGKEYILFFGEDNFIVQDWANGDDPPAFNGNWQGDLDNPNWNGNNNSKGWRGALDLGSDGTLGGQGANDFRENFTNGWPGTAETDDVLPVKKGNMSGPTSQGREARLFGEEDELFDNFNPRRDYDMGRVVLVPIVSLLHNGSETERFTIGDFNAGADWDTHDVIIDGFAPFWLLTEDEQGNVDGDNNANNDGDWVIGRYIPGTRIRDSNGGGDNLGAFTPPKLTN